jgi:EpsI family protein
VILERAKAGFIATIMCAAAALAYVGTPVLKLADQGRKLDLESAFPAVFADWRIDESLPPILPSPELQAKLDRIYNQVLSRTYINDLGERVMLSVAYGGDQSDGTSAHKPEVCYPAQGFQILANRRQSLDIGSHQITVRQLVSQLGSRVEPITYWIVTGNRVVTSAIEQKMAQIGFGIQGLIPDGLLVRVSSIDRDVDRAFRTQHSFIQSIVMGMDESQRSRVAGIP